MAYNCGFREYVEESDVPHYEGFDVAIYTDNWGHQGPLAPRNLGPIPSLPGWHAEILFINTDDNQRVMSGIRLK